MNTRFHFTRFGTAAALLLALTLATPAQPPPAAAEPAAPPATPTAPAAPATSAPDDDRSGLRRIDVPADAATGDTPAPTKAKKTRAQQIEERNKTARQRELERAERAAAHTGDEVVNVFGDSHLAAGQKSDVVVAVFGSAVSEGEVIDSVVSVFGSNRVTGPVRGEVVAVFGNSYVNSPVSGKDMSTFISMPGVGVGCSESRGEIGGKLRHEPARL